MYCFNFGQVYQVLSDWVLMHCKSSAPRYKLYAQIWRFLYFLVSVIPHMFPLSDDLWPDFICILLFSFWWSWNSSSICCGYQSPYMQPNLYLSFVCKYFLLILILNFAFLSDSGLALTFFPHYFRAFWDLRPHLNSS